MVNPTRVLVAGASGLVGASVVRKLLSEGHQVIATDVAIRPQLFASMPGALTLESLDVTDLQRVIQVLRKSGARRVIHLAALLPPNTENEPFSGARVNVLGTSNVFEAARALNLERVVYASSNSVHGDQASYGDKAVSESDPCIPYNLYGLAKQFNEMTAARYRALYGLDLIGLRLSTVFGHGGQVGRKHWVSEIIDAAAAGRSLDCPLSPDQKAVVLYVDDAAEMFARLCLAREVAHPLFLTGGDTVSMAQLVDMVRRVVPQAVIRLDPEAPNSTRIYLVDDSRIRTELGLKRLPLQQRIADFVNVARADISS